MVKTGMGSSPAATAVTIQVCERPATFASASKDRFGCQDLIDPVADALAAGARTTQPLPRTLPMG